MLRRQLLLGAASASATAIFAPHSSIAAMDSSLEAKVEAHIKRLRGEGRVASNERTAWSVYDMTTGRKLVSINENTPMQAASLIKPFVCQAFFYLAQHEGYQYGPRTRALMEGMIRRSSNDSTNALIKIVGGPAGCERVLRRYGGAIFQNTSIVEYIPSNGRTYRNKASARDYSRFLYAVWNNNVPYAREMRRLMGLNNRDRLKTGARWVPSNVKVYDKTGSTSMLCGNFGMMVAPGRNGRDYPYTMIGIIEKQTRTSDYGTWMRRRGDVIRDVSGIVYQYMKTIHPLA